MEQILYICLGALLALFGGIVTQRIQNYFNQKKEDEYLFFYAYSKLIDYCKPDFSKVPLREDVWKIAIRIRIGKNYAMAQRLFAFGILGDKYTEEELTSLKRDLQTKINEPFFKDFYKDIKLKKRGNHGSL